IGTFESVPPGMNLPAEPPPAQGGPSEAPSFSIGRYRPIYLWAGPGTIRMNRLKFMGQPVDEAAHREAHLPLGAQRVVEGIYSNWVHLTYNWGFPPEVEAEDWADFARAAQVYHAAGAKVFAYIQSSNCVFDGSYRVKDWYVLNPQGKKIFYYSGRYMTCLANPEWTAHLKEMIRGALERGADGIFLDNLWHGAMPDTLFATWLGGAGCHCARCRAAYHSAANEAIPREIRPGDGRTKRYLRWRADQVTRLVSEMQDWVEEPRPGTPLSANDYDFFLRDTYLVFGQDLEGLSRVQDVVMIENHALPRLDLTHPQHPRLVNNALVLRSARRLVDPKAHLSVLSYDQGIGFEGLYPPRRYQLAIAEAAACGASMTVKGTEYFEGGQHTLLTPAEFAPLQAVIGGCQRWLEAHADLFQGGQNCAEVGLLFPGERLWLDWMRLARLYQGAGQVLTWAGIPWRVVKTADLWGAAGDGLRVLLTFGDGLPEANIPSGLTVVDVPG
ncbi:MAG: hypothetical protein IH586_19230, partial [Anaerolineaceae bacterium]|nr:hypothetical protein [Anaerolineaceae bacterium]